MDVLPDELVSYIFDFLHGRALTTAMLVNRKWYLSGARNLHFSIVLNLVVGLTLESDNVVVAFMKRLTSPLSTAHLIHHLTLSGFASPDIQGAILDILSRADALRSLNVHGLHLPEGVILLSPDNLSRDGFLPNLTALNTSSAQLGTLVAHARQLEAIRIHEPLDGTLFRHLTWKLKKQARGVKCLELVFFIGDTPAAIELVACLASALADSPLCGLALQFVYDSDVYRLVSWADFESLVSDLGPYLQYFRNLRTLSLVIRPDPLIPAITNDLSSSGAQHREVMTRVLAERLVVGNDLTFLERVELRWHGWTIKDGQMVALPQTQLVRLPQRWLFEDFRARNP